MNNKIQTDVVYFDFAKAFDSVQHDIILKKLRDNFGINGKLLKFFVEYLKNRGQRVLLNNEFSMYSSVLSGVPQGSILGPLLFVLFINDIVNVIDSDTNILIYADDTKIWRAIGSINDQVILQNDINALYEWSMKNKIKFHPKKCKILRVSLAQNKFIFNYEMNQQVLEVVESEKDLGVIVTQKLKWTMHQTMVANRASQKLGLLKRTCSFTINKLCRKVLFLSIVRSQLEHCSVVWDPTSNSQCNLFEKIQKRGFLTKYTNLTQINNTLTN